MPMLILKTNQIQFNFCIAMRTRPNIERRRSYFINQGYSKTKACKINPFDVMFAGITGFDPDVVVFRCVKISEFCWPLLAAVRTNHAAKFP